MSDTVVLLGAALTWFTPLAATRVYENAFGLSYTSVNLACLSMTLFFMFILGVIYMLLPYPSTVGRVCSIGNIVGIGTQLLCTMYMKSLDPYTKILFWISAALVGFNFADILLKALVAGIARTQDKVAEGSASDANKIGSICLLGLPAGMLMALAYTEMLYDVRDTYFVNEESAMKVCFHKCLLLTLLNLASTLSSFILNWTPWASSSESPLTTRTSLGTYFGEICTMRTLGIAIEIAMLITAAFFTMM